jgi:hypothetical protein
MTAIKYLRRFLLLAIAAIALLPAAPAHFPQWLRKTHIGRFAAGATVAATDPVVPDTGSALTLQ